MLLSGCTPFTGVKNAQVKKQGGCKILAESLSMLIFVYILLNH